MFEQIKHLVTVLIYAEITQVMLKKCENEHQNIVNKQIFPNEWIISLTPWILWVIYNLQKCNLACILKPFWA